MIPHEIEVSAKNNDEMPDALNGPEQCLFLSFRQLYRNFRTGAVTREQAGREKQRILKAYDDFKRLHDMYSKYRSRWIKAEPMMSVIEKNIADCPTCDTARKIIRILDGREK
jgi:hypothetical protein